MPMGLQIKRLLIEIVAGALLALVLAVDSWGVDLYVSSGVRCATETDTIGHCNTLVSNGVTAGNDTTGDGTLGNPYLTPEKAAQIATLSAPGVTIFLRGGFYEIANGFIGVGNNTILPSGTAGNPVTWKNYNSEVVWWGRAPGRLDIPMSDIQAGVHFPTLAQCTFYASLFPGQGLYLPYPQNCVGGTTSTGFLWQQQDETNGVGGAIVDMSSAAY